MSKSQQIFNLTAPYNNQYQGDSRRVLFVCTMGLLRSPTAANVGYTTFGWNTRSCGTDSMALIPLSVNLIEWAEKIVFVDSECYDEALKTFGLVDYDEDIKEKGVVLNIDDEYNYHDPWLIHILTSKLNGLFPI